MIRHACDVKVEDKDSAEANFLQALGGMAGPNRRYIVTRTHEEVRLPWRRASYRVLHVYIITAFSDEEWPLSWYRGRL